MSLTSNEKKGMTVAPKKIKLVVTAIARSKAKFLKVIPLNRFLEREKYDLSFEVRNVGENEFPGGYLCFHISWPSGTAVIESVEVDPLKTGENTVTKVYPTDVLSRGYGLIFLDGTTSQGKPLDVEFYVGEKDERRRLSIPGPSLAGIRGSSWEEFLQFWTLIAATATLIIIAVDTVIKWIGWFIKT